jgi:hypothetical protein
VEERLKGSILFLLTPVHSLSIGQCRLTANLDAAVRSPGQAASAYPCPPQGFVERRNGTRGNAVEFTGRFGIHQFAWKNGMSPVSEWQSMYIASAHPAGATTTS